MSTVEIKTELQQMIEHETDMSVLQAIRTILIKTGLNPILKEKLTIRALKSEEDLKAGRVFSKEEVIRRTNASGSSLERGIGHQQHRGCQDFYQFRKWGPQSVFPSK